MVLPIWRVEANPQSLSLPHWKEYTTLLCDARWQTAVICIHIEKRKRPKGTRQLVQFLVIGHSNSTMERNIQTPIVYKFLDRAAVLVPVPVFLDVEVHFSFELSVCECNEGVIDVYTLLRVRWLPVYDFDFLKRVYAFFRIKLMPAV